MVECGIVSFDKILESFLTSKYTLQDHGFLCNGGFESGNGVGAMMASFVAWIPLDSALIFPFDGSVLVCGREQLLL